MAVFDRKPALFPREEALNRLRGLFSRNSQPHPPRRPEIGEAVEDGTIYAGMSPSTLKPMYVLPRNVPGSFSFEDAEAQAAKMRAEKHLGHDDWRVPTLQEIRELWKYKNDGSLRNTFNWASSFQEGYFPTYWTSSPTNDPVRAWAFDFRDGQQRSNLTRTATLSVRIIR